MNSTLQQFDDNAEERLRRYVYEDTVVYAADVAGELDEGTVDVVDGTVMLVEGNEQVDFEVPEAGEASARLNNGVLTVEVDR